MKKVILLFLIICAGCQAPTEENYVRNVKAWVGHTPEELISQWGEPTQVISNQGSQYYIYMIHKDIGLGEMTGNGGINEENAVYPLQNPQVYQADLFCQTTFVVQNGIIQNWSFEGNDCVAH